MERKRTAVFCTVSETSDSRTFTFGAGGGLPVTVTLGDLVAWGLRDAAALHGVEQKLRDSYALPAGATPSDKRAAFNDVLTALRAGAWNRARGAVDRHAAAKAAIGRLYSMDAAAVEAWGAEQASTAKVDPGAFWTAMARDPEVRAEIDRAAPAPKLNTKSILAGLKKPT